MITITRIVTPTLLPFSLGRDLLVTSDITNRTSRVHFTNYNEDGYQWTVATMRNYWLHWDTPFGLDPSEYSLHKMDLMNETHGWVYLNTKYIQVCCLHDSPSGGWFARVKCVACKCHARVGVLTSLSSFLYPLGVVTEPLVTHLCKATGHCSTKSTQ